MLIGWRTLNYPEVRRTYVLPDNKKLEFTNVLAICITPSGTHYLECDQGKVIVRCKEIGVTHIILDTAGWTYPAKE